jgi:L-lactate utilization protein LutC
VINFDNKAREMILRSIREHLALSVAHDAIYLETSSHHEPHGDEGAETSSIPLVVDQGPGGLVEQFRENLEGVDGHCVVAHGELEVVRALASIIVGLEATKLRVRRIALSDDAIVERLVRLIPLEVDEVTVAPDAAALFGYDLGITSAQAAIAETGTLVLDSARERHRLVSLVPPVHIAIVEAANIRQTLGETLSVLQRDGEEVSPTITFVTGPSRTADIELTLAIGVHGPQELYVIVNDGPPIREVLNSTAG